MKRNKIIFLVLFLVFFLFDVAVSFKVNFLFSLSFVIAMFLLDNSLDYILYLFAIDAFFGKFIGLFTFPITSGVFLSSFVYSKFKIPFFVQILVVDVFVFFTLFLATKNADYSVKFGILTFIFSSLFLFLLKRVLYA